MIACGTVLTSNGRNHAVSQLTRLMSPSATPATQSEGGRCQVPRLPRKVPRRHHATSGAQARHRSQPSAVSATPVTQKVDVVNCHA